MSITYSMPIKPLDDIYSILVVEDLLSVKKSKNIQTNIQDILMSFSICYDSNNYYLIIFKPEIKDQIDYDCWLLSQDAFSIFSVGGCIKWLFKGRKSFAKLESLLMESIGVARKQQTQQDGAPDS